VLLEVDVKGFVFLCYHGHRVLWSTVPPNATKLSLSCTWLITQQTCLSSRPNFEKGREGRTQECCPPWRFSSYEPVRLRAQQTGHSENGVRAGVISRTGFAFQRFFKQRCIFVSTLTLNFYSKRSKK
jgi:hypothetical protein